MGYYSRLRDLREDKDLSIRKLAEILHMQRTTYHNYETALNYGLATGSASAFSEQFATKEEVEKYLK